MHIIRTFLLVSFIILSHPGFAQDKMLTMEDAVIGQWQHLYPETIHGEWLPESALLLYKEKNEFLIFNPETQETKTHATLESFNKALKAIGADTMKRLPRVHWVTDSLCYVKRKLTGYIFHIGSNSITTTFDFKEGDKKFDHLNHSQNGMIAVVNNNSLYIITDKKRITVAKSEKEFTTYGQAVSRREFGISKGTFWSPKGNYLAYYINDNSDVKRYPLVDITKREAEAEMIAYPMAGMASEHVSLGVFNSKTNETTYIENDDPKSEKYLTNISWGPNEAYIYIQVLNRAQNHMKLNQYDAKTGKLVKTLFEEQHEKYVEPYHKLMFIPGDAKSFLYQSRKDGYNHIYHYTTDGKLIGQLTKGSWEVTNLLGFDAKAQHVYYTSTEASPLERQVYKVGLKNPSQKTRLTQEKGTHRVRLTADGRYLFDSYTSTATPRIVQIINTENQEKHTLLKAENPLKEYNLGEMTLGTIKAADSETDLHYRLIKPAGFDRKKKYPAIVYVYGGPHAQLVTNSWLGGARLWQQYMAQNGYVVLTIDNRGSANRGLAFENIIHRQCGKHEMADQLKGTDLLKSFDFVDTTKIGVHGWSYGGFMTTSLLTNYPGTYKVGVAGGPVIDWKYYEVMYGERYMDTPEENPEGYASTSLIPRGKDLDRKLLIIHGGVDPTVVQQHSLVFVRECIKNNVPVDYFVYPRAEHNVRGKDRIHLMQKVTDYFNDYLK